MTSFRLISVFLISFLLLSPMIRHTVRIVEKPLVVLGIDKSRSIISNADSTFYKREFIELVNKLTAQLEDQCEVKTYSFGDNLVQGFDGDYRDPVTDISLFFNEISTRYTNRNAAALILASDGIYNEGTDPFYASRDIAFPVYTIALGDTAIYRDLLIRRVTVNKIAYKGEKFPVEVLLEMKKANGTSSNLTMKQGTRIVETRNIRAHGDNYQQKVVFYLDAREKGIYRFDLSLDTIPGERSLLNNRSGFIVEVIESRQKVAVLSVSPHPDVAAIVNSMKVSTRFDVDLISTNEMPVTWEGYDLVVLNQIPSVAEVTDLKALLKSTASLLFIIGSQSDINAFNAINAGLVISGSKNSFVDATPWTNESFSLFTLEREGIAGFNNFPPLQSPFGTYQFSPLSEVLFYQKIGNVPTQTPLALFVRNAGRKVGFIAGENFWRWRISSFQQNASHEGFDLVMEKMMMYLSARGDKSFFRINLKNRFTENEPVEIDAEVFNATYELINEPDVTIAIKDSEGKSYPFIFSKLGRTYYLNTGLFPVGEYSWEASVNVGSETFRRNGKFFVEPINIESTNLVADHSLLYRLASAHNGEVVSPKNLDSLAGKILARQDIRSVSIYNKRLNDLIGNPWLFVLIVALLTAEWIFRKREGM